MAKKRRKFTDDGWAVWVDGDDISTVYINDWINPKGNSYVDLSIRIRGVKASRCLSVYVPFPLSVDEIDDVSLHFQGTKILQATFSAACIVDYMKNAHTSEIAYNGKTVDIVHISTMEYQLNPISDGTLIRFDLESLQPFLDNDEAYFAWRMPHKTLDEIFKPRVDVGNAMERLRDLITTPVVSEKYGYAVRINETRLLPTEITQIGAFHRQKLQKAVITISINESYDLNDGGCYRIRRMEEDLYQKFLPKNYPCDDVITYHWKQSRDDHVRGQFHFYYSITKESVSRESMFLYLVLLMTIGVMGDLLANAVQYWLGWFQ